MESSRVVGERKRKRRGAAKRGVSELIETPARGDRGFVVALARGLEILRTFKPSDGPLGNQEIAERTGLPKPTVSRLTHTLSSLGYLVYLEPVRKYRLGAPVLSLGYACLAGEDVREVARPLMQELADYSGVSVGLGGRDRLTMLYLESCRADRAVTLLLGIGSRIPIATTSMGRAYLAAVPKDERTLLVNRIRDRSQREEWPRIRDGIAKAIDDIATRGFTVSFGEWNPNVAAVGVPLVLRNGSSVKAFNCGGPSFLLDRKFLEKDLGPRLVEMVRNVEFAISR